MAKRQDDYLTKEATRIGLQFMLAEVETLLMNELSEGQRIALTDQQSKIKELLEGQ